MSLTGQDNFRKEQIHRRDRKLGVLFVVTWERFSSGKFVA